jgi:hypothetical protein
MLRFIFLNEMRRYKKGKGERVREYIKRIQMVLERPCVSGARGFAWVGAVEFCNEGWGVSEISDGLPSRSFCGILVSAPLD